MDKYFKNTIVISLFLFIVAVFWFVYEYSKINQPQRTFSVTAEGKEVIIPNIAEIRIGVVTQGKNLSDLQNINTNKINKIIKFLKEQGIDNQDIKTENYSITPNYDYQKSPYQIIGYTINQNLVIKVRNLAKVGQVLEGVVKNGANNVSGPNFTFDDQEVYLEKAREKAIESAKEKAQKIAQKTGFKLGKIININEYSGEVPVFSRSLNLLGKGGSEIIPQIEPGSQEVKVQITITYEIK
jgi:uncharacterized protein YggE